MNKPSRPALGSDDLWKIERIGAAALSPDGRQAVCSVTRYSMEANQACSSLWLLPTERAAPRVLTTCGSKDGQPAWSPRGDAIAFLSRREQQGSKDSTPQLYLIAPDGGEARRVSDFGPGIEAFKWLPDGQRVVFSAWVWPQLRGAAAQTRQQQQHSERKATGYVTSEAFYRYWDHQIPMDRVLHLMLLDTRSGSVTDLFEGTALELPRDSEGSGGWDVSPDGRRVAFVHDPAVVQRSGNRLVLSEIDLRKRRCRTLVDDAAWDLGAPRYRPRGSGQGPVLAFVAAQVGRAHTALGQLALLQTDGRWQALRPDWDHHVDGPLRWTADGQGVLFGAEDRGRRHLYGCRLADAAIATVHAGGWVQGFDVAAGTVLVAADSARHPVRLQAVRSAAPAVRLEHFNDDLLSGLELGEVREHTVAGAGGAPVQVWLTFPPGFNAKREHPAVHVIHGGPYAAAGDTFGYRWNPHVFAAAGRVVVQVNYHGSSGFGFAFRHSLIGRQGELELQDIEATTDWLLTQGWVDKQRITATGGSYGGFLVAWMNGHVAPGRYRAYVCHAGVYDRIATFSADSYTTRPLDLQARYWEDMPRVLAQSPHAFAAHMSTPTLVIHGAQDFRVPDCNGLAYFNTLKALGVDARLLWFPDENHWVLKPRNSLLWYAEFASWLDRHEGAKRMGAAS
jgi:dipeptidyl aminopeptidase/acylaminoacyl peptidase